MTTSRSPRRCTPPTRATAAVGALLAAVALSGCATAGAGTQDAKSVSIVGFSVLKTANQQVIADFQKTPEGKGVTFTQAYGASGDQARSVVSGLPTDEAHLSLEPDVTKLTDAKLVSPDWKSGPSAGPDQGILTQSVVVMVVRKGNPKAIRTWDDLVKPGVGIVTPNPGSSGSAKWNILAAYGHVLAEGGSAGDASAYLTKFLKNVVSFPGSGKDATTAFEGGTGDVLLSYENEAIEARQAGADFDYVIAPQTLLIQNPAVLTTKASSAARAFLAFQQSTAGQTDYAEQGFRPIDDKVRVKVPGANDPTDPFPIPTTLMTIDKSFGGWDKANKLYFDDTTGIVTKLLAATGKS